MIFCIRYVTEKANLSFSSVLFQFHCMLTIGIQDTRDTYLQIYTFILSTRKLLFFFFLFIFFFFFSQSFYKRRWKWLYVKQVKLPSEEDSIRECRFELNYFNRKTQRKHQMSASGSQLPSIVMQLLSANVFFSFVLFFMLLIFLVQNSFSQFFERAVTEKPSKSQIELFKPQRKSASDKMNHLYSCSFHYNYGKWPPVQPKDFLSCHFKVSNSIQRLCKT